MKKLVIILFLLIVKVTLAQEVIAAIGLDTLSADKKEIFNLWRSYLHAKPDSLYNNPYWNDTEKKKYNSYDLLKSEGFINPSLYYFKLSTQVLSITQHGDYYVIRSLFYQKDTTAINTWAITNVVAKQINGKFLLYNYLPYYAKGWTDKTVGLIKYHYYPSFNFTQLKADEANAYLRKICKAFSIKPDSLDYYIAPDCDDVFHLQGFDYVMTMGNQADCGFYDAINRIVYAAATGGENHYHELTHVINKYYPKANELLLAGISAYWSKDKAHFGQPLIYHIKRVNQYLLSHPNLDLIDPAGFYQMDAQTNPRYVIGALICDRALKQSGIKKLQALFNCGTSDADLYKAMATELNLKKSDFNAYFRKTIAYWASQNEFRPFELN